MKAYLIICVSKDNMYFHNITGKDLLDAIKNALEENLEYFGNSPESSPIDISFIEDSGVWEITEDKLKAYARWHLEWINGLQHESIDGSNYNFFVFDITKPEEVVQPYLETIIKSYQKSR